MARFRQYIIAYFILGAVMMGGGAVTYQEAGVPTFFIQEPDNGTVNATQEPQDNAGGIGGMIKSVVDSFTGGLILVWELVTGLFTFMNWPIVVLQSNNAPPMATVMLGGPFTAGFYGSVIGLVKSSA